MHGPELVEGENQVIRWMAAVAWEAGKPLSIEQIEFGSRSQIKISATAIYHTDTCTLSRADFEGCVLVILRHEGTGIVESVGEGVTKHKAGDSVIPFYFCLSPKTNLCQNMRVSPE